MVIDDANGKIIDLLIEHGADVSNRFLYKIRPVNFYGVFFQVNRANSDGYTPLHFAIIGGHKKAIEMLIEKGSNVNAVENNFKMTPLLFVVIQDSWNEDDKLSMYNFNLICVVFFLTEYAELLINHGADVFAKAHHNNHEGTALDFAHSEKCKFTNFDILSHHFVIKNE